MKKQLKRIAVAVLLAMSVLPVSVTLRAEETAADPAEFTILYTNDVHCAIDGYAPFGGYKAQLASEGKTVLAVDAGDCTQGDLIGTYTKGEAIIDLMNLVPYDVSVPGNHEFDYKVPQLFANVKKANQPFLCCNFRDLVKDKLVFDEYLIKEINGYQVGFVGIITPETYVTSTPDYFKDENGKFIYSFCETNFYETIQTAVDHARDAGAEIVIAIGHVGVDGRRDGQRSIDIIENTRGIDAFIDGHSHEEVEGPDYQGTEYKNLDGKVVPITQTGTKFAYFGEMNIRLSGRGDSLSEEITTRLIKPEEAVITDASAVSHQAEIQKLIDEDYALVTEKGKEVAGVSEAVLPAYIPGTTDWKIRVQETSLGDFVADALRWKTGADIGLANGGGCRADLKDGTVTAGDIIKIAPWGQNVGVIEATGQQILDSLELGVYKLPEASGGFLQVSGLSYEVDDSVESPVVLDEKHMLDHVKEGKRRVNNVKVGGEPIDPDRTYTVGSVLYVIQFEGDGQTVFSKCKLVDGDFPTDTEILVQYVKDALGGKISKEQYGNPDGEGRIVIRNQQASAEASAAAAESPAVETPSETAQPAAVSGPAPQHSEELPVWGKILAAFAGVIGIWLLVRDPKNKE